MSSGYVFYCSKCNVDHAGECPPSFFPDGEIPTAFIDSGKKGILEGLSELIKALEAGNYNAAPTTLHQCSQDPPCICFTPVDEDDITALQVRNVQLRDNSDGTVTMSYEVKLPQPLKYIQLTFYLDGI